MNARWSSGYEVVEPFALRGGGIIWPCRVHIQTYSRLAVGSRVQEADKMLCVGSCLAN